LINTLWQKRRLLWLEDKVDPNSTEELRYWLYLPENYAAKGKCPFILFLHGAGERGDDLEKVKVHGPPKLVGKDAEFPFVVVSPQCPRGTWWQTDRIIKVLDHVAESSKVDADRVYLTGLSMGGFGSWALVAKHPDRWAAVVPICGGGDPETVEQFKHLPLWVFHGAKDGVIPLRRSEEMVAALRAAGGDVKLTVYPEAGHDSWTAAYDNPELYQWLLSHRRKK